MKNLLFPNKCKMFFDSIVLCLLTSSIAIFSMDEAPSKEMVNLQLDDKSLYPIERWKVIKESNTLRECYYSQGKKDPIFIPGISPQEIALFSTALDKNIDEQEADPFAVYFDGLSADQKRALTIVAGQRGADGTKKLCALRLTAQLADTILPGDVIKKKIIAYSTPARSLLIAHFKSSAMIDSLFANRMVQSVASSWDLATCCKKLSYEGAPILFPKIKELDWQTFNGKSTHFFQQLPSGKKCEAILCSKEHGIMILEANDLVITRPFEQNIEAAVLKKITHPSTISKTCLSPDKKWLVSLSLGIGDQQMILTQLDKSNEQYPSDIVLVNRRNTTKVLCFNSASTLLVFYKNIEKRVLSFFSLEEKKIVQELELFKNVTKHLARPIELAFNHVGDRLIAYLNNKDGFDDVDTAIMIWDTSDVNDIKELQLMTFPIEPSAQATINFSYPEQDTVAISTAYRTFFFDVQSGDFLGEAEAVSGQEKAQFVAACFMPHSPIMCIAKNIDAKTSCINFHNKRSGKHLGTTIFNEPKICGIGMTINMRNVVATFEGSKTITTNVLSDEANAPIPELFEDMKLIDFYALLELYRAKKENKSVYISKLLLEYIRNFGADKPYGEMIKKCLY